MHYGEDTKDTPTLIQRSSIEDKYHPILSATQKSLPPDE